MGVEDLSLPGVYTAFQHWGKHTAWVYSDPHFSDEDLEHEIPNRPSDEDQIKSINSCVGRKDTLILLGDVGNIECVRRLRGYKVLIMGNHDVGRTKYERKVENKIYDQDSWNIKDAIADMRAAYPGWKVWAEEVSLNAPFNRSWNVYADNMLFDEVYEGALIVGEKLILSHEPVDISWLYNIHGHDHSRKSRRRNHLNVCSDVIGYRPVNLNHFLKTGPTANIQSIHRLTINNATRNKKARIAKVHRQQQHMKV